MIRKAAFSSDTQAFDSLVAPYVGRLRGYLRGLAGNASDADDMAQTALTKAWTELHTFDARGRFAAWLFRIAHREFLQSLRARRRYAKAMSSLAVEPHTPQATSGDGAAAQIDVNALLATLDEDSRAAIILSRAMGFTHPEIATALDKPLGTVKSLISRATRQMVEASGHD
ncbi:MAG: RNA polymerase sigma factor [Pseudomonadota bacterium]